jgi:hypothetical protein
MLFLQRAIDNSGHERKRREFVCEKTCLPLVIAMVTRTKHSQKRGYRSVDAPLTNISNKPIDRQMSGVNVRHLELLYIPSCMIFSTTLSARDYVFSSTLKRHKGINASIWIRQLDIKKQTRKMEITEMRLVRPAGYISHLDSSHQRESREVSTQFNLTSISIIGEEIGNLWHRWVLRIYGTALILLGWFQFII